MRAKRSIRAERFTDVSSIALFDPAIAESGLNRCKLADKPRDCNNPIAIGAITFLTGPRDTLDIGYRSAACCAPDLIA